MTIPPVLHIPGFCPDPHAVFAELLAYPWRQELIQRPYSPAGTLIPEPRKVIWYAPPGNVYVYAGKRNTPLEMTPLLIDLGELAAERIEQELGRRVEFNSVFCNLYEDGNNYIGWHADDEPGIISDVIASISLGATRDFKVRRENNKQVWTFPLANGDLAVMYGDCQENYKHCVPKRKKVHEPRINLTYRLYKTKTS